MMEKLGDVFDRKNLEWKKEVEKGVRDENEILASLETAQAANDQDGIEQCESTLTTHRETMHPGYSFTGDNVDINCATRQMTLKNSNKDHHMFLIVSLRIRYPQTTCLLMFIILISTKFPSQHFSLVLANN